MILKGGPELRARLKAISTNVFKPAGKDWADETARIASGMVGSMNMPWSGYNERRAKPQMRLLPSIRRKSATAKKAVVVASYHAYFVDAGVKSHSMTRRSARLTSRTGRTIFAAAARKPHPGYPARPFRVKAATEALRRKPVRDKLITAWNEAA
jgi:hypothetical protein